MEAPHWLWGRDGMNFQGITKENRCSVITLTLISSLTAIQLAQGEKMLDPETILLLCSGSLFMLYACKFSDVLFAWLSKRAGLGQERLGG